jgi:ABC-2 type transport system ATP-binding protein
MSTSPPAIEALGLGRDYGSTRALDALDLVVHPGTTVGLLGPNGAGKTTAMLLLATLLTPSRGTARVYGHDIARERAVIRCRLGLVFQETSIDGLLTVQENLLFAARLAGLPGAAARRATSRILEITGLTSWAAKPARQLSTGWRRLADLARALLHQPDLLILDEPTVGLDPEHRDRAWKLLELERRERGVTILFSTHYLSEAEDCDRVVLLSNGRVVAADAPAILKSAVGDEVLEIEGSNVQGLLSMLDTMVTVRLKIKTERGYRIGISGSREGLARLAGIAPGFVRFVVRPTTLDDVYFARTQDTVATRPVRSVVEEPV